MSEEVQADAAKVKKPWPSWVKWLAFPAQVVLAVAAYFGIEAYNEIQAAKPDALVKTARRLNGSLPQMIDDDTRLDRIEADGRTLIYRHTILAELDEKPHPKRLRRHHAYELCQTDEERSLHEHGVTFRYVYESRDLEPLADVEIPPEDCP